MRFRNKTQVCVEEFSLMCDDTFGTHFQKRGLWQINPHQALLSKDYEKQDVCILRFCMYKI